jgi:hypothetical protein
VGVDDGLGGFFVGAGGERLAGSSTSESCRGARGRGLSEKLPAGCLGRMVHEIRSSRA